MKKTILFTLAGLSLVLVGCVQQYQPTAEQNQNQNLNDNQMVIEKIVHRENQYELQYPNNYRKEKPVSDVAIIRPASGDEYLQIQVYTKTSPPGSFGVAYMGGGADSVVSEVTIGGKKATKYYTENPTHRVDNKPYTEYIIVLGDKKWIQIYYYGANDIASSFEEIISTIKIY